MFKPTLDLPDHPVIRRMESTGYPDGREPEVAHCPICGKVCETIYRDKHGDIFGCDECIRIADAYDVDECFPENSVREVD